MKNLFLLTLILLAALSVQAQKGLKLGAFVQPQFVYLYNADDLNLDLDQYRPEPLWGMSGGVTFGYHFNRFIGFRLQGMYSQQGGSYSSRRSVSGRTTYVTRLEYLKVPLMLGFNTNPDNRKTVFALYGGIQANLLTRAFTYNDNPVIALPLPENITDFPSTYATYRAATYSIVGETGIDVKLPPDNFVLNIRLRADYELTDTENKDASFRLTQGGTTTRQNYWTWARGISRDAETFGLTAGLVIGVTYTFGQPPVE
ncbi:MAG: outer membrane beta-barrel protein [Bacteroidia bacterium]|nr:outer membrane beta-barrel protein [Bacteroidia bacterium]